MQKLLVLGSGRRVELIQTLKKEMNLKKGIVIAEDIDKNTPAIHFADQAWTPHTDNISSVHDYCKENKVTAVIALIDPMIVSLTKYSFYFEDSGIKVIHPTPDMVEICNDKMRMSEIPGLNVPETIICKPRCGSSSRDQEMIRQPLLQGNEYNVTAYFDYFSHKLIDLYAQEKIWMRAGETERGKSIKIQEIFDQVYCLGLTEKFSGPIDIDIMESKGKFYVIDINPRFGGGYQMSKAAGVPIAKYLVNNVYFIENCRFDGPHYSYYEIGKVYMKYDTILEA